jgi:FHS family L-fucose permease-like MFS transporter
MAIQHTASSTILQHNKPAMPDHWSIMASLMFMIGFITCLNDILLPHLKIVFDLSYAEASAIRN